jgi:hypothetical protein
MLNSLPGITTVDGLDSVAHIIQVALTPVFLLSGIGTLLNVFNTRLTRVSDHMGSAVESMRREDNVAEHAALRRHLVRLQRRRTVLDAAVVLGALGGASTCGAAFVLFLGGLRDTQVANWLFILFGAALGCIVAALIAFLADSVLAWHGLRREGQMPHPKTSN